jgi:hypothetical protein
VPTFDEVRTKIEAQYAKALGTAELSNQGVEARMLEIEQASVNSEAQNRLAEMRNQMGLPPGAQSGAAELGPGAGQTGAGQTGTGQMGAGQMGAGLGQSAAQLGAGAPVGAPAGNDQAVTGQPGVPGQQVAGAAAPEPAAPSDG